MELSGGVSTNPVFSKSLSSPCGLTLNTEDLSVSLEKNLNGS